MKTLRILSVAALGAATLVVAMPTAQAATITVTAGQSIQTAIDFANGGDTINIGSGTFHEAVVVYKDLTIIGHNTVIQPPTSAGWGVCITADPACVSPSSTLSGVSISGVTVQKSPGFGFEAIGADDVTLSLDHALNNKTDGFLMVDTPGATLTQDYASGNKFAGFETDEIEGIVLTHDQATNNGFGFFADFVDGYTLQNSIATSNCAGLFANDVFSGEFGPFDVSNDAFSQNVKACPGFDFPGTLKGIGAGFVQAEGLNFTHNALYGNGLATKNAFTGGLVVYDSSGGADNVITQNSLSANLPFDIRTDDTGTFINNFSENACQTSMPSGLCP